MLGNSLDPGEGNNVENGNGQELDFWIRILNF